MAHGFTLTVYYEDTDAGGIVYYANYLKFAERARTEMLRGAGISQKSLWEAEGVGFVVKRCEMEFHAPARLDDTLSVVSAVLAIEKVRLTMEQKLYRGDDVLTTLKVELVCVDKAMRPTRIPEAVVAAFAG